MTIRQRMNRGYLSTKVLMVAENQALADLGIETEDEFVWSNLNLRLSDITAWMDTADGKMTEVFLISGDLFIIAESYELFTEFMKTMLP